LGVAAATYFKTVNNIVDGNKNSRHIFNSWIRELQNLSLFNFTLLFFFYWCQWLDYIQPLLDEYIWIWCIQRLTVRAKSKYLQKNSSNATLSTGTVPPPTVQEFQWNKEHIPWQGGQTSEACSNRSLGTKKSYKL
jgi:hypothetical protein